MFRPLARSHRLPPRRGGAVLLTMFALIVMLMLLGLVFMTYAASEKALAERYRDAASSASTLAPDPGGTADAFFGALIFDTFDDGDALYNVLRGHSIARSMYGSRPSYPAPTTPPTALPPWDGNPTPWIGVGTFHEDAATYLNATGNPYPWLNPTPPATPLPADQRDRARFVNHTVVNIQGVPFLVDPEWTGNRAIAAGGAVPDFRTNVTSPAAPRSYVGKHAGYTYPDLKNLFLAAQDPATGEVLTPSFYREWLFRHASQPAGQSGLHPNNPNWSNDLGRLLTLRPRPQEHPNFPRIAPDADGVYRGDVQNLPGGYKFVSGTGPNTGFIAMMDSHWLHIGLQPAKIDGRLVQPMVAALILPMDGSFDQSMHGNRLGAGGAQFSYGGYGAWEKNIGYGTANEADRQALLQYRAANTASPNNQPARTPYDPYTTGRPFPTGQPVVWNAAGTVPSLGLPATPGSLLGQPAFTNFQNDNAVVVPHSVGHNTNDFPEQGELGAPANSPMYPFSDLKRLHWRYAFTPDWYFQSTAGLRAPTTFVKDPASQFRVAPDATWVSNYRLDPAHALRKLSVPRVYGLDRPALTPTFVNRLGSELAVPNGATKPGPLFTGPVNYPAPQPLGGITDFAAGNQWVSSVAALGSVNLNRPLADYRVDPNQPLSALNNVTAASAAQADLDRQQLARDIFARLIVTLGAAGRVSFDPTYVKTGGLKIELPDPNNGLILPGETTPPAEPQLTNRYNALRYLAQVAVNLVDYIDNDDVNTVFVWNPSNVADPSSTFAVDATGLTLKQRGVVGVEKPRLLLNEVYAELTNDPTEEVMPAPAAKPTKDMHARFWAELVNPSVTPSVTTGILGDGSAALNAYQIQIARGTAAAVNPLLNPTDPNYHANSTGEFGVTADATYTFPATPAAGQPGAVQPNNGQYAPALAAPPLNNGFVLVGPPPAPKQGSKEFNPSGAGPWAQQLGTERPLTAAGSPAGGMGYTTQLPATNAELSGGQFRRHVVLLRRAANPYITFGGGNPTNPYVTVDVMDYVPAFDAVHRGKDDMMDRGVRPGAPMGYDPVEDRFAVGKVQPFAGHAFATTPNAQGMYNTYTFGHPTDPAQSSMVLNQTATPALPAAPAAPALPPNEPKNTFGRHNGNSATVAPTTQTWAAGMAGTPAVLPAPETIMAPFDWLTHPDRPLETLGDVFHARDCRPHLLTDEFVRNTNAASPPIYYEGGNGRWRFHDDGLARALALLTVKSPDYRVAHGGRTAGPTNVNALQDSRVAQGVWDPQAGNAFNAGFVDTNVWGPAGGLPSGLIGSRTGLQVRPGADGGTTTAYRVPVPGQRYNTTPMTGPVFEPSPTLHDVPSYDLTLGAPDRPILPYGAPSVPAAAMPGMPFAYPNPGGTGTEDTVLRRGVGGLLPYLYNGTPAQPYLQSEPFRKVSNGLTTVSHTFVVYLTIGYFEVSFAAGGPPNVNLGQVPTFGAEVYDKIPGDMRQKYIAVVDMSNLALRPQFPDPLFPAVTDPHATERPFFTALDLTARAPATPGGLSVLSFPVNGDNGAGQLTVNADGVPMPIQDGTRLVLGYGADTQVVTVVVPSATYPTAITPSMNGAGSGSVTVTGLTRDVWAGACVSNVRPGYAGPRSDFTVDRNSANYAKYRAIVPYVERLR